MKKPDCYKCIYRREVPGDSHSSCINSKAKVEGHRIGVLRGWFMWPFNFDPAWLIKCSGFKKVQP